LIDFSIAAEVYKYAAIVGNPASDCCF